MNNKEKGEKGQSKLIGFLADFDVDIALPLSDNLPWDMIIVKDGIPKKIQVKTSEDKGKTSNSIRFDFRRCNWHKKTQKTYSSDEIDAIVGFDKIDNEFFIFLPSVFEDKSTLTLRKEVAKNGQKKGVKMAKDYLLNEKSIKLIFY